MFGMGMGLMGARRSGSGIPALPKLAAGVKVAAVGDSIIALPKVFTTAAARTTADNRSIGELTVALGRNPRFKYYDWWDSTSTNVNRGGVYTAVTGSNADIYRSGATLAWAGDTVFGVTKRRAQITGMAPDVVWLDVGTNTDSPDTAAQKITWLTAEIAAYRAAGIRVVLGTVRPRSSGDRETLNNVASITSGSAAVTITRNAHGLTNTSAATKEVEFISPGLTIGNITLNGRISSGTGGYTVNVVDANTITITGPTTASSTISSGGGSFTWHRNFFTSTLGLTAVGLCIMPSSTRWTEYVTLNAWIVSQHDPSNGIYVVDFTSSLRDASLSATTGVHLEIDHGLTNDGVHPNHKGAWLGGVALNAVLDQVISDGYWYTRNISTGNLLANPTHTGTSGTIGASCTGQLPTSFSILNVSGAGRPVTCACSLEANAETGGQTVVLTITSTGAGTANTFDVIRLSRAAVTTGYASTDWVYGISNIVSTASPILGGVVATIGQTSTISNYGWRSSGAVSVSDPGALKDYDHTIEIMVEPLLCESRTNLTFRVADISVRADVAGTTVVRVPYTKLFIGPDPSTDFPWVP